jgi:hypothetical protein
MIEKKFKKKATTEESQLRRFRDLVATRSLLEVPRGVGPQRGESNNRKLFMDE